MSVVITSRFFDTMGEIFSERHGIEWIESFLLDDEGADWCEPLGAVEEKRMEVSG